MLFGGGVGTREGGRGVAASSADSSFSALADMILPRAIKRNNVCIWARDDNSQKSQNVEKKWQKKKKRRRKLYSTDTEAGRRVAFMKNDTW